MVVGVVLGVISVAVPHLRATSGLVRTLSPEEARLIDGARGIVDTAMHDPRTLHGDGDGEDEGTSDRTLALFEQRRRGSLHDSGGEEEEARRESAAGMSHGENEGQRDGPMGETEEEARGGGELGEAQGGAEEARGGPEEARIRLEGVLGSAEKEQGGGIAKEEAEVHVQIPTELEAAPPDAPPEEGQGQGQGMEGDVGGRTAHLVTEHEAAPQDAPLEEGQGRGMEGDGGGRTAHVVTPAREPKSPPTPPKPPRVKSPPVCHHHCHRQRMAARREAKKVKEEEMEDGMRNTARFVKGQQSPEV